MKQSKFFSVYILIHCIILALVVGMAAAAFSMSNGLLLLENPTTATTSANSRAAMVGKVEATKDKIKKSIKPVVGGCEIWDTGDRGVIAGYFRAKRWGVATTTADNLLGCDCPTGTNKILIYSGAQNVTTMANPADEWRFKYNLYLARNYADYSNGTIDWTQVSLSPVCVSVTGTAPGIVVNSTSSKFYSQRANTLVANATTYTMPLQVHWVENNIPANYAQQIGYCFVYHGITPTDGNCCCDSRYCYAGQYNPPPEPYETVITDPAACSRAQTASQYYGIARDNEQWSTIHNPYGGATPCSIPSGCGLVVYNHQQTSTLPSGATTSVQKWVCVSNTDEGWDNNWGLP